MCWKVMHEHNGNFNALYFYLSEQQGINMLFSSLQNLVQGPWRKEQNFNPNGILVLHVQNAF